MEGYIGEKKPENVILTIEDKNKFPLNGRSGGKLKERGKIGGTRKREAEYFACGMLFVSESITNILTTTHGFTCFSSNKTYVHFVFNNSGVTTALD